MGAVLLLSVLFGVGFYLLWKIATAPRRAGPGLSGRVLTRTTLRLDSRTLQKTDASNGQFSTTSLTGQTRVCFSTFPAILAYER